MKPWAATSIKITGSSEFHGHTAGAPREANDGTLRCSTPHRSKHRQVGETRASVFSKRTSTPAFFAFFSALTSISGEASTPCTAPAGPTRRLAAIASVPVPHPHRGPTRRWRDVLSRAPCHEKLALSRRKQARRSSRKERVNATQSHWCVGAGLQRLRNYISLVHCECSSSNRSAMMNNCSVRIYAWSNPV
jgi:hypothetical protein